MKPSTNILHRALFVVLLQCCVLPLFAQITLRAPKDTISFNETVTVTLSGEVADISSAGELPQSSGFVVVARTSKYAFSGNQKIRLNQTFTLQPLKTGTFSVGPAWVQAGSRRIFSNAITIVVRQGETGLYGTNTVFLRCEPSRKKVYRGEQVVLTLRLYSRVNNVTTSERPLAKTFNGFLYQPGPYPTDRTYKDTVIVVKGITYLGHVLYREFVYPNTAGKLVIPSYHLSCSVRQSPFPTNDALIDDLMAVETPLELNTEPVPIEVLPLPENGKPADFLGDAGNFSLSASIDKTSLKATEVVKLSVTVSGEGNISFLQLQPPKFPDGLETFPPVSSDSTNVTSDGVSGYKTFTFTLIPKKEGQYTIPAVTFSYFDAAQKKYVTLQTEAFKIDVTPAPPQDSKVENNLPESFLTDQGSARVLRIVLLILLIPAIAVTLLLFWRRRKKNKTKRTAEEATIKTEEEITATPSKNDEAKTKVNFFRQNAERFMQQGNQRSAFPALYEALMTAVCATCELGREEASIHQLRYRLGVKGFSAADTENILAEIDRLSGLRYSTQPLGSQQAFEILQNSIKTLLKLGF